MADTTPRDPLDPPEEEMIAPPYEKAAEVLKDYKNRYEGRRCFIVGNGPSLVPEDLDKIVGEFSFGSNQIYRLFNHTRWRPNIYTRLDSLATWRLRAEVAAIDAELKLLPVEPREKVYPIEGMLFLRMFANQGNWIAKQELPPFSEDITVGVHNGMSVTYINLQIAAYLGFKEIVLLGMDHQYTRHWHIYGGYDDRVKKNPSAGDLSQFLGRTFFVPGVQQNNFSVPNADGTSDGGAAYSSNLGAMGGYGGYPIEEVTRAYITFRNYAEGHGIRVVNATRGGKLEVFQRLKLEKVLGLEADRAPAPSKKKEQSAKKSFQSAAKKRRG